MHHAYTHEYYKKYKYAKESAGGGEADGGGSGGGGNASCMARKHAIIRARKYCE